MMDKIEEGMLVIDDGGTTYFSLTNIARKYAVDQTPSYVIQNWLRSHNTLEYLKPWEEEKKPAFKLDEYEKLLERRKASNFTLTSKQRIENTGAIGIISKQGKGGGTYAAIEIAYEFMSWISPRFKKIIIEIFNLREMVNQIKLDEEHWAQDKPNTPVD